MTGSGPVAAVDCGTNSTRLLVARPDGSTIDRRMVITRLGGGVDRTGRLNAAAIGRTMDVLTEFAGLMRSAGVVATMATATSAVRDAENAEEFLGPATRVLGVTPVVLAGDEEGRLSYLGATAELDTSEGPFLVVDVGGGSTELVTFDGAIQAVSLDVGCVRVTERFLLSDPPHESEISAACTYVSDLLAPCKVSHPAFLSARRLVGLAGTVSALARMTLGLPNYDREAIHHARLRLGDVVRLSEEMAAVCLEQRRAMRGMEPGRADVLVGGSIVLGAVMEEFGYPELIASESDILDGIVAELLS